MGYGYIRKRRLIIYYTKQSVSNHITSATTKYGLSLIFSADQDLDPDDSNKWIISVGHPSLGQSKDFYLITKR